MYQPKTILHIFKIIFLFCTAFNPLVAQSNLRYEKLTPEDGLSSIWILDIFQDSYGFIWIATTNGLNRYDGYEFKHYLPVLGDTTSISGSSTTFIYEDKNRNIWVGTWSNGLNLFDRNTETFKRFVHDPNDSTSISDNALIGLHLIAEDHAGNFWVGTDNGINLFDQSTSTFRSVPIGTELRGTIPTIGILRHRADERAANRIRAIYEDHQHNLWVGTDWGGLYRYNYETKSFVGYFPDPDNPGSIDHTTPGNFLEDDHGNLWIANYWYGICKLNLATGIFQRFPNDPNDPRSLYSSRTINGLILDKNILWIGSENGLFKLNTLNDKIEFVEPPNQDFEGFVYPLLKDRQGNHWFSTTKGLIIRNSLPKGFRNYTHDKDNPKSLSASSGMLGVDSKGVVYVMTESGIDVLNEKKERIKTITLTPGSHTYETATCFLEDQMGNLLFVGTRAYKMNTNSLEDTNPTGDNPTMGYTTDVLADAENNIWFAGNVLSVFNPTRQAYDKYYPKGEGNFGLNTIYSMLEISPNLLLLGGVWDGLLLFNTKERKFVKQIPIGEEQSRQGTTVQVLKIFRSQDNRIWLGTNYGLSLFNMEEETFRHYDLQDGLSSNTVNCILEDDHQNLWLSTNNGISKFDPKSGIFRNYDHQDGLQGNEYNAMHGAIKHPITRELWFSGPNGITVFHPDSLQDNPYIPPVLFTKLVYYNKMKNNGEAIIENTLHNKKVLRFSHADNIIEFHFAALNFVSPEKNKYAYRLLGFNDDWVNLGTRREVSFTNLNPGHYTLQVKASNNDGIWNEEGASINIYIMPPWYRTWWAYGLYSISFLILIWRLYQFQKERTIRIERERTQRRELEQAKEIEKAYTELQSTQALLIQSEKMASLGELTAGIAHEIQNPLNFVNNFSEVNTELIDELQHELKTGNTAEAITISNSIKENEEKINHHGKRADAIVKGMLQHSRSSSGVKEPTDINALADEYLRLAYHGLRAKDKSFNATMKTDFDNTIGLVNVIPQDIGRVILNLITNAFYAVSTPKSPEGDLPYIPTVIVSTKQLKSPSGDLGVHVSVRDNGPGIPKSALDKIFQPFFTTKPTGQGTGLGLSLSYDIVKAHGGELKVETKEGEGSEFIISLPAEPSI